jgi:disulfide bond formation protein DsbB
MKASSLAALLSPSRRKVFLFILLFFCVVFYLPTVKCLEDVEVKEKMCEQYQRCSTDMYFTLAKILTDYDRGSFNCPHQDVGIGQAMAMLLLAAAGTYVLAAVADAYYARFRDF